MTHEWGFPFLFFFFFLTSVIFGPSTTSFTFATAMTFQVLDRVEMKTSGGY